eukprot:5761029-Pyramimonas_sp.AAC.1
MGALRAGGHPREAALLLGGVAATSIVRRSSLRSARCVACGSKVVAGTRGIVRFGRSLTAT